MNTVIITGASSGLGAHYFSAASKLFSDAEFWLVARRKEKLEETAALNKSVSVRLIPCDLGTREGLKSFFELIRTEKPRIRLLINNAGFGRLGRVSELTWEEQSDMVSLNCGALTALCAECSRYMQKGDAIINVASIASFAPTPNMTVYSSTKAFVRSLSVGMRQELKKSGINVLAVCPGPMRTEFLPVANITDENSKTFRNLPYCDPKAVSERSVKKALAGRAVYTNKLVYKFYRILAKLLPHTLVVRFSKC